MGGAGSRSLVFCSGDRRVSRGRGWIRLGAGLGGFRYIRWEELDLDLLCSAVGTGACPGGGAGSV